MTLEATPCHRVLVPGRQTKEHLLLRVRAAASARGPRPKLSAVLVPDAWGSMQGEPLEHAIRSAERLAKILDDDDSLGVVAFEDEARTVSPLRPLGPAFRDEVG